MPHKKGAAGAQPPLFTAKVGDTVHRAYSDDERDAITATLAKGNRKVENIRWQRFKGLGEMMAAQLKETTMDPRKRTLLRVMLLEQDMKPTAKSVEQLMGNKAETRFAFIQENAQFAKEELLDV